jgi:hypothetical protein
VVLSRAIDVSPHPLSAQAVGNAFYGLQGMSSESAAVRGILRSLARKVAAMPTPHLSVIANANANASDSSADCYEYMLSGQHIGNALWGLRNATSSHEEVREALGVLSTKITQSRAIMNGQNVGMALYSLHAMDLRHSEVRGVMSALAHKLVVTTEPFSGLDIGMSLYGLRAMDSQSPEVRVLLGALIHKMRSSSSAQLQLRDLTMAIIGVLKTSPWIRDDFLSVLAAKTPGMTYLPSYNVPFAEDEL